MPDPDPRALADTVAAHDTGGLLELGLDPGMPDVAALAAALPQLVLACAAVSISAMIEAATTGVGASSPGSNGMATACSGRPRGYPLGSRARTPRGPLSSPP